MKKKILSGLLSFCMLLCLLPAWAFAEGEQPPAPCTKDLACSLEDGHEGACVLHEAGYQEAKGVDWAYGTLADACANVYSGGGVVVLRDVELEEGITVTKPMTITSNSDTPYTITYSPKDRGDYLLTVQTSGQVALANIILDGGRERGKTSQGELVAVKSGQLGLTSGTVIQNNDNVNTSECAGGLRVIGGMAFVLEGAAIRNCRGTFGGGAALAGDGAQMAVSGGVIENCEAFCGGGVFLHNNNASDSKKLCRLNVQNGGIIRNNRAVSTMEGRNDSGPSERGCGGGIYMERGIVTIPNGHTGTVEGNHADLEGGGIYDFNGTINLFGGTVTGNDAKRHGGGIATISPTGSVAMGNTVRVTGNTSGDGCNNLYLDLDLDLDMVEGGNDPTVAVMIAMPLTETASIGICRHIKPDAAHTYRVVATGYGSHTDISKDLEKFYSDDPKYVTLLHEDLASPDHGTIVITNADVAFDNQKHGERPPSQLIGSDRKVKEPGPLEEPGYGFEGWYTEPEGGGTKWEFETDTVDTDKKPQFLYAKWDLIHYDITYDLGLQADEGDEVVNDNPDEYTIESKDIILKEPVRVGYRFLGWKEVPVEEGASLLTARLRDEDAEPDIPAGSIGDRKFVAQWEAAAPCTVTYTDGVGGAAFAPQEHSDRPLWSATPPFDGTPKRSGYTFTGWEPEVAETVSADVEYVAQWKKNAPPPSGGGGGDGPPPRPSVTPPALESKEHFAYIVGYPDGRVRPEARITRAEAASIFFRLMTDEFRDKNWSSDNSFPDVEAGAWYNNAVSTCARAGLIRGFEDGTFGGDKSVTRAEFAAIAARFLDITGTASDITGTAPDSGFTDMEGHWGKGEVDLAAAAGWVKGFPDGSFHPDGYITRAEAMTLVNRMLGRVPRAENMWKGMVVWPDNPADAWYYADVQEATNGHTYVRTGEDGPETWTGLIEDRDWTGSERDTDPSGRPPHSR